MPPAQDLPSIRHSRMVAMNQMMAPMTGFGLVFCVLVLVGFSGWGLLTGKLESSNFTAIAAYLFGVLSGVLGVANSTRVPQRATDVQAPTLPPASTVTATGGETPKVTVSSP